MLRTLTPVLLVLTLAACTNKDDPYDLDEFDTALECDEGAEEVCDGIDNNCDGFVDEGATTTFYLDADGDGFGIEGETVEACELPEDHAEVAGDCDDAEERVHPEASEVCNEIDDDCDGAVDDEDDSIDAASLGSWYADVDGDGAGAGTSVESCVAPEGHVASADDCDDADAAVHPGAEEICNGADDNCDGGGDEGLTCTYQLETEDGEDGICVDDDVNVDVGGERVFTDSSWGAQCHAPIQFSAAPGDLIDLAAFNSVGGCRGVSDVYLRHVEGEVRVLLANGSSEPGCDWPASRTEPFWTASAPVPGVFEQAVED